MNSKLTGAFFVFVLFAACDQAEKPATQTAAVADPVLGSHCYLQVTQGASRAEGKDTIAGPVDSLYIKMDVLGELVNGEYKWLPQEKDRKTGTFTGTLEDGIATVLLTYSAEGTSAREELLLKPEANGVRVGSGQMVESEGVWLFKDKSQAVFGELVPEVPCK